MDITGRARWGARHAAGFGPAPLPASEVWLHHSVTVAPDLVWVDADGDGVEDDEERAMRTLEDIGQQRFGGGISYTFAVMPSGRVYEGHGVGREGAHTRGRNSIARAIVLIGNYQDTAPTAAQVRAVADLLRHGHAEGWWRAARLNGGHRSAPGAQTACPGDRANAAIPDINRLATEPTALEAFMSALSDVEQRTLYNRVVGFLRQRWYVREANGSLREVPEGTKGAIPATALDTLDGNYLVGLLGDDEAKIIAAVRGLSVGAVDVAGLAAAIAPLLPRTATPDEVADAVRTAFSTHLAGAA